MGNTITRVTPYDEEAPPINEQPSTRDGNPVLSEIIVHVITDMFYTHKSKERIPNGDACYN